ncbi:MAG: flagellar basal body L-ring protein FlgH, partial [Phycisphaerae bacterium]
ERRPILVILIATLGPAGWALGQSSSLFRIHRARRMKEAAATTRPATNGALRANAGVAARPNSLGNLPLARYSLTAVSPPEPTVIKVNDLIGVIIRHRYNSKTKAKLEQDSEWDLSAKLEAWFRIHDRKLVQQPLRGGKPEVNFNNTSELDNKVKSDRRDILETRMMGKVIDVKPNGNLIIIAAYSIGTDLDTQTLVLSGEINSRDIKPDRTVTSDKIFDLKIGTASHGAIVDTIKRGWFKELLDNLKPF